MPNRITRTFNKIAFRTDTRIGTKYANSSFHKGTILWNKLPEGVQKSESIIVFKQEINKSYKKFNKRYIV